MSSNFILINRYHFNAQAINEVKSLLNNTTAERTFYFADSQNELIEFSGYNTLEQLVATLSNMTPANSPYNAYLTQDIQHELLQYVESPVPSNDFIPHSAHVQLRHVEVLPDRYQAYLRWREETIFDVVRQHQNHLDAFDAYHSLISSQPGVMFIAAFSGDIDSYLVPFNDAHYQDIVKQAANYITGAERGLSTKLYHRAIP